VDEVGRPHPSGVGVYHEPSNPNQNNCWEFVPVEADDSELNILIALGKISIKDVMSTSVNFVKKDDKISDIISKMSVDGIHELPVVEKGIVVGIVTYDTLLKKKSFPLTSKAEVVMQSFPQLSEWDPIVKGIEYMINSLLKDLPVLRNGRLVGMVYRNDMLKILTKVEGLGKRVVSEIMTPKPEFVREEDDIRKALSIMRGLDEKNLPVVDKYRKIGGVIGMKDILRTIWKPKKKPSRGEIDTQSSPIRVSVGSIMNSPAITVKPKSSIENAIKILIRKDISTLFVVEDSKLLGVVTPKDILEQAMSMQPREGVYVQLTGLEIENPDIYDSLYSVIQKGMSRIAKRSIPNIFNAHVATYHHEGLRSKYSVHARLTTEDGMFFAKTTDWDLFKAMNETLEVLERVIRKQRGIALTRRRRTKK